MKKIIAVCLSTMVLGMSAPLSAEEVSSTEVYKKLEQITETQNKILDEIEQVKAELQVIKVRTTR